MRKDKRLAVEYERYTKQLLQMKLKLQRWRKSMNSVSLFYNKEGNICSVFQKLTDSLIHFINNLYFGLISCKGETEKQRHMTKCVRSSNCNIFSNHFIVQD